VPPDLVHCFLLNGFRRLLRATPLLPGRFRLQPPHYNSSRIARDLPAHRRPARCAAAPPLPAAEPVFARPCRVTPTLAYACSRHLGVLLPRPNHSRARQPRLQRPPRALRSTPAHATGFRCVTARMFAPPARRRSHSLLHRSRTAPVLRLPTHACRLEPPALCSTRARACCGRRFRSGAARPCTPCPYTPHRARVVCRPCSAGPEPRQLPASSLTGSVHTVRLGRSCSAALTHAP
jgi:hypothetical protein